jgi:hypothetical protein
MEEGQESGARSGKRIARGCRYPKEQSAPQESSEIGSTYKNRFPKSWGER